MKKITKICAVVAACLAAIGLTGCPDVAASIGKDDFYGTWMTLDFDTNGHEFTYYKNSAPGEYQNHPYSITWNFDGKAENMFNGTGGTFWQHLVHYNSVNVDSEGHYTFGDKVKETFWYGEYAIKGNSGYSKGKLYLYYECGYDFPITNGQVDESAQNYHSLAELKTWKTSNFLTAAGLTGLTDSKLTTPANITMDSYGVDCYHNNRIDIQVREVNGNKQCSDIEYFRFNLKDGSASGYTRMMATVRNQNDDGNVGGIYNQWATSNRNSQSGSYKGGYKVYGSSSWTGQTTRFMGRISVTSTPENPSWLYSNHTPNSSYFNISDASDITDYADPDAVIRAEE